MIVIIIILVTIINWPILKPSFAKNQNSVFCGYMAEAKRGLERGSWYTMTAEFKERSQGIEK